MASKRSRVHPKYKTKYKVRNWSAYDRVLVRRGDAGVASQSRDKTVERIGEVGRRQRNKESGYHRQARVENTFFRYKHILSSPLRARDPGGQEVEVRLSCKILNRMTEIGMPESYAIRQ